jgi:hypothetical protein
MPAPYPYDAVSSRRSAATIAAEIFGHYVWLARWSDEIGDDPDLDLKKLAQLGFIHCRLFAQATAEMPAAVIAAVEARFAAGGITWAVRLAMLDDFAALAARASTLHAYVRDQVPEARAAATLVYSETGDSGREQVTKLAKPHPAAAEVAKLRALFAART